MIDLSFEMECKRKDEYSAIVVACDEVVELSSSNETQDNLEKVITST